MAVDRHVCGWLVGAIALMGLSFSGAMAATRPDAASLLLKADGLKTSDHERFVRIIEQVKKHPDQLTRPALWHLRFLEAWQAAYGGNYSTATAMFNRVIAESGDDTLRFRSTATLVNILGIARRYEDAFVKLNDLVEQLPRVSDKVARFQGMGEISQLYIAAGQYDLASIVADKMLADIPPGETSCKPTYFKLHARYRAAIRAGDGFGLVKDLNSGVALCRQAGEMLVANSLKADAADIYIRHGEPETAIGLLHDSYVSMQHDQYPSLTSHFNALLAAAHLLRGDVGKAREFALATLATGVKSEFSEPSATAYRVLYRVEKRAGHDRLALGYHEKYMAADKAYLDDVSAKAVAYQMVNQQVQARKAEIDGLARQNQILQLQQALDRKAVEASRLYIAILLLGLFAIGLWLLRLKRSQLEFMRLAQSDGLTGIYNRKHFMAEAERVLRQLERTGRGAAMVLIDLDHFKLTNDTYGHAMGDLVLRRTVLACQQHMRATDVFGRLGGEEFGVLLPDCSLEGGSARAELLRRAIAAIGEQEQPGIPVSGSFGVTCIDRSGYHLRQLLIDADNALYRAKRAGRNRVMASAQDASVDVA